MIIPQTDPNKQKIRLFWKILNTLVVFPIVVALLLLAGIYLFRFLYFITVKIDISEMKYDSSFWNSYLFYFFLFWGLYLYQNIEGVVDFINLIRDIVKANDLEAVVINNAEILPGSAFTFSFMGRFSQSVKQIIFFFGDLFKKNKTQVFSLRNLDNNNCYTIIEDKKFCENQGVINALYKVNRVEIKYYKYSKIICDINILEPVTEEYPIKENKYKGLSPKERKQVVRKEKKEEKKRRNKDLSHHINKEKLILDLNFKIKKIKNLLKFNLCIGIYLLVIPLVFFAILSLIFGFKQNITVWIGLGIAIIYIIVKTTFEVIKLKKYQKELANIKKSETI